MLPTLQSRCRGFTALPLFAWILSGCGLGAGEAQEFRGGFGTTTTGVFTSDAGDEDVSDEVGGFIFPEDFGGSGGGGGPGPGPTVEIPPNACVPLSLLDERRSLIETNSALLAPFSLRRAFERVAINGGLTPGADTTHDLLIDHSNDAASAFVDAAGHCDDELTDGSPSLNGFPLTCPRIEGQQIGNLDNWFPIAMVNRLDLAPADGAHCGEQRMIYANNSQGRMFIILEAQIPNPNPGCGVAACRPIAEMWAGLSDIDDVAQRRQILGSAFFGTHPALSAAGFPPFMRAQHMSFGTGQLRTNNFDQFPWDLKEFKLVAGPGGRVVPEQVAVAANPFGPLLNDAFAHPLGPACRTAFIDAIEGLVTDDVSLMALDMPAQCLAAESLDEFDNLYDFQISLGSQTFRDEIEARAALLGNPLTAEQVGARAAFAGSCIGCHQQQVGADLGNGIVGPFSQGFVHVDELFTQSCGASGGQCFAISGALDDHFLPTRHQAVLDVLAGCPDACGAAAPAPFAGALTMPSTSQSLAERRALDIQARASHSKFTITGRPTAAVH
ncbi:MAG: hypothetical protein K0V04_12565 [Deltaproteobacteria bacterium]|nr:hypothetical protein [Deltaproteobacteria bacterium]